jgi:hypothetical protein
MSGRPDKPPLMTLEAVLGKPLRGSGQPTITTIRKLKWHKAPRFPIVPGWDKGRFSRRKGPSGKNLCLGQTFDSPAIRAKFSIAGKRERPRSTSVSFQHLPISKGARRSRGKHRRPVMPKP